MSPAKDRLRRRPPHRPAGRESRPSRPQRPEDEETRRLVARAAHGDREARRLVVEQHMRLVASIARRYRGLGLPAEDVEQEGVVGLLEAIDRYDPSNGASFPTYAYWRIRQAICHALTDRGRLLRVPKEVVERRRLIARSPLAEATGLSPAQVAEALLAPTTVASLDAETGGGTPLRDVLSEPSQSDPLDETVRSDEVRAVDRAVLRLPSRERAVIEAHFGFGREPETLATVGRRLGLSETRVRALERRALRELATDLEPEIHRS